MDENWGYPHDLGNLHIFGRWLFDSLAIAPDAPGDMAHLDRLEQVWS